MQVNTYRIKKFDKFLILFLFLAVFSCSKKIDVSGIYKKTSGKYRYDIIVLKKIAEKSNGGKYSITTIHEGKKKFKTFGKLKDQVLPLGFIASMKFYPGYKKFLLQLGNGSVFEKQIIKAKTSAQSK